MVVDGIRAILVRLGGVCSILSLSLPKCHGFFIAIWRIRSQVIDDVQTAQRLQVQYETWFSA